MSSRPNVCWNLWKPVLGIWAARVPFRKKLPVVPSPEEVLQFLRWLFPGDQVDDHIGNSTIEEACQKAQGMLQLDSWAGRREIPCEIVKEMPDRFLVRLGKDCLLPGGRQASKGGEVYVPKDAVKRVAEKSMAARIEERV